jgi:hypothetical protein
MLTAYAAVADLAHWYGMPCWGLEMLADTPQLNAQAGAELAMTAAWALLCNFELVHNAGLLGACKVCPPSPACWPTSRSRTLARPCGRCRSLKPISLPRRP